MGYTHQALDHLTLSKRLEDKFGTPTVAVATNVTRAQVYALLAIHEQLESIVNALKMPQPEEWNQPLTPGTKAREEARMRLAKERADAATNDY
jgi:hypothetical protein